LVTRLDAGAARGAIEFHPAEGVGKVAHPECRHRRFARPPHRLADPHQAIGDGILGMQTKMDETRIGHGAGTGKQPAILTPGADSKKQKAA